MESSWMRVSAAGILTVLLLVGGTWADTPANCTREDVVGEWLIQESARSYDHTVDCNNITGVVRTSTIRLESPNVVIDEYGNRGHWTMIYNQGFEVTVNERSYFAFSDYDDRSEEVISYCNRTQLGWAHDVTLRHWSCFTAHKPASSGEPKTHSPPRLPDHEELSRKVTMHSHEAVVQKVNAAQSSWHAELHKPFVGLTRRQLLLMAGGHRSWLPYRPRPAPASEELKKAVAKLPKQFDWRNVSGINYVSPVKNQYSCGSCFIFSTIGMLEARTRVRTNNTQQTLFSEQEVLSCDQMAQGCDGGFPYLVSRYTRDYGVVEESCYPAYSSNAGTCERKSCDRHYVARYRYIGGYFGNCNEEGMMLALMRGPIAVNYEYHSDQYHYKSGVYHYTGVDDPSMEYPYYVVNHAVLVVGYGVVESTGEKYWIVKNSWGATWGDHGYFLIRRGTNECGIESLASESDPIP
ncbi:dipeptidyl peptidase 1-like [Bacillus rossius redtenbacheri]|uniref:dipeptidyl peptidase 1-like n=1 Tax=Bacillus rossius redtenbacheri TaxID=93214 RepID=UPI002FDE7CB0